MTGNTNYWFKPKTYGYGATPSGWKGWAAIAVFVMLVGGVSAWLFPAQGSPSGVADVAVWLLGITVITVPFVWLCRLKTDGEWRWQWGKSNNA